MLLLTDEPFYIGERGMAGRSDLHALGFDHQADGPAPCPHEPVTEDAACELHLAGSTRLLRCRGDLERQPELF
jgi:hypothetical protein